jgi:hypothetical protein
MLLLDGTILYWNFPFAPECGMFFVENVWDIRLDGLRDCEQLRIGGMFSGMPSYMGGGASTQCPHASANEKEKRRFFYE